MRILVLDDDKARHRTFKQNLIGHLVTHVFTVDAAREALVRETFDVVYLDHDLNDHEASSVETGMYGNRELTGVDVAVAIAALPREKMPQVAIVHSYNPDGAKNIVGKLRGKVRDVVEQKFHAKIGLDLRGG